MYTSLAFVEITQSQFWQASSGKGSGEKRTGKRAKKVRRVEKRGGGKKVKNFSVII